MLARDTVQTKIQWVSINNRELGQVLISKSLETTCKLTEFQYRKGKEMDIIVKKQVLPWMEA